METFFLTDLFQDFVLFRSEVVHTGCSEDITLFLLDRDLQIEQEFALEVYYQHIKEAKSLYEYAKSLNDCTINKFFSPT